MKNFSGSKNDQDFNLNLTPMINIMAILIFFLIKSFSTQGELISKVSGLELPLSSSTQIPKLNLNVIVSKEAIMVEEEEIEKIPQVLNSPEILIKPLESALKKYAERSKEISKLNKTVQFKGIVTIQADKSLPFKLLKKIMYTCGQTEYSNISLMVFNHEKT